MKHTQQKQFDKVKFQADVKRHLLTTYMETVETATPKSWYLAMARALSEQTALDLLNTENDSKIKNAKSVNYLSMEFLIGRLTGNNLISMGLYHQVDDVMKEFGHSLTDLLEEERDPSLGNGGLGRLAACFMDSCAAQEFPTIGYGLHYEYGLFKQSFVDGEQKEAPDRWQGAEGYPWEMARPQLAQQVGFFGHVDVIKEDGMERSANSKSATAPYGNHLSHQLPVLKRSEAEVAGRCH
jgi:glycogen phosphorylase